jgi:hypothetical protein
MVFMALEDEMELIRMEYHELPGQALTVWQAQRLWNLSDQLCEHALRSLVRDGFLMATSSGMSCAGSNRQQHSDALRTHGRIRLAMTSVDNPWQPQPV